MRISGTYIARTIEGEVESPVHEFDEVVLYLLARGQLGRIHEIGGSEFLCRGFLS